MKCPATGKQHRFTHSLDKTRSGTDAAFCVGCGEPNPRCVDCHRKVEVRPDGSTRCYKGHVHRRPPVEAFGVRELRELAGYHRRRPPKGER